MEMDAKNVRNNESKVVKIAKNANKIAKNDPRKLAHCVKVGLALTLNSLFYYYNPLYDGFGQCGIWAVLTVVVVFEFTVGATLSKSLNRAFATLFAASLGIGVVYLAQLCGREGEPIVLGAMVFILASVSTFTRFLPGIKKKFDYGVVIFILTFSMVTVSGYRVEKIVEMAYQRLITVVIGGATCIIISILVFPAWAGEDLSNLVSGNLDKLANSLQGFGNAYFSFPEGEESGIVTKGDKAFVQDYKSVLNSKASEESLATFAWWEIGHGGFRFGHPWKQYLKVGILARECASHIHSLSTYLLPSQSQASLEFMRRIEEPCMQLCLETSKALRELSTTIKTMTHPSQAIQTHLQASKSSLDELNNILLQASPQPPNSKTDLFEIIPTLCVISILMDINNCVDNISNCVHQLSICAHFKNTNPNKNKNEEKVKLPEHQMLHRGTVKPVEEEEEHSPEIEKNNGEKVNANGQTISVHA